MEYGNLGVENISDLIGIYTIHCTSYRHGRIRRVDLIGRILGQGILYVIGDAALHEFDVRLAVLLVAGRI